MASPDVIAAVRQRLDGFTAAPLYFPNEALPDGQTFVAVQFPVATEEQASIGAPGSNVFREEGVIRFTIAVRAGSGTEGLGNIATALRNLFRNARFGGVRSYVPTTPVLDDRSDAAGSFKGSFVVPYDFDTFA